MSDINKKRLPARVTRRTYLAKSSAVLAGALGVSLFGCDEPPPNQFTIALSSRGFLYGGLLIAEKAGLFEKRGLQVKMVVMDSGNAAITALISGSAQFSSSGPGELLAARTKGQDLVIISNIYRGLSASVILDKELAEGIGTLGPGDIEGRLKALDRRSIAVPSATSVYLHPIKAAMENVGAEAKFVYMAQTAMPAALRSKAINAFAAASPYSEIAVENKSGVLWISGPKREFPEELMPRSTVCLQTTRAFANANPDVVLRMRQVMDDAAAYIVQNPREARHNFSLAFPQVGETVLDRTFADEASNWIAPEFTRDDIEKEIMIYGSTGLVASLENVDPSSVLWRP